MLTKEISMLDDAAWSAFAAEAMSGLIQAQGAEKLTLKQLARTAAEHADAMMIERESRLPVYLRTKVGV